MNKRTERNHEINGVKQKKNMAKNAILNILKSFLLSESIMSAC